MIHPDEVRNIAVFSCLSEAELLYLAEIAADLQFAKGEWLIREGSTCGFFVILSGRFETYKEVNGREEQISDHYGYGVGDFVGEVPILLGTPSFASIRAAEPSRVMRIDPTQLRSLMLKSPQCGEMVMQTMNFRVNRIKNYVHGSPLSRVQIFENTEGLSFTEIRRFLSMSGIEFEVHRSAQNPLASEIEGSKRPSILVDGKPLASTLPTTRAVASALGFRTIPERTVYDVAIVGAGPAGLAAAVAASSEGLRTIVIERAAPGGQAATSSRIENYPGFPGGLSGDELTTRALKQAEKFKAEIVVTREVQQLYRVTEGHCVEMDGHVRIQSRAVLLSTGVEWRRSDMIGVDDLLGKGVFYGAAKTESAAVVGKNVFIIGGGNSAGQAALFLSGYAATITMIVRGPTLAASMSDYLIERLRSCVNIRIETRSEVVALEGEGRLEGIYSQKTDDAICRRPADALFLMLGAEANTSWLPSDIQRDPKGFVLTGPDLANMGERHRSPFLLETSMYGVFCAGDVRHGSIKRVASSVGEGSMTVSFIHQYLGLQE